MPTVRSTFEQLTADYHRQAEEAHRRQLCLQQEQMVNQIRWQTAQLGASTLQGRPGARFVADDFYGGGIGGLEEMTIKHNCALCNKKIDGRTNYSSHKDPEDGRKRIYFCGDHPEIKQCQHCGEGWNTSELINIEGGTFCCKSCEGLTALCTICGKRHFKHFRTGGRTERAGTRHWEYRVTNGIPEIPHFIDPSSPVEETTQMTYVGLDAAIDAANVEMAPPRAHVPEEPKYFCDKCFRTRAVACFVCGEPHLKDESKFDERMNEYYCNYCTDKIAKMEEDGRVVMPTGRASDALRMKKDNNPCNDFPSDLYTGVEIETERTRVRSSSAARQEGQEEEHIMANTLNEIGCVIKGDGSLSNGLEVVTRPARGADLRDMLRKATTAIQRAGFGVRSTCGLHIHIGVKKMSQEEVKRFVRFYLVVEDLLFDMLPESRRDNRYCHPLSQFRSLSDFQVTDHLDKIVYKNTSLAGVTSQKKEHSYGERYLAINLHSFFYRGTLEFRLHSGSVNYIKIRNWINILHLLLKHGLELPESKIEELRGANKGTRRDYFTDVVLTSDLKEYYLKRVRKFSGSGGDDESYSNDNLSEQELNNLF